MPIRMLGGRAILRNPLRLTGFFNINPSEILFSAPIRAAIAAVC